MIIFLSEREREESDSKTAILLLLNGIKFDLEFRDIGSVKTLFDNLGLT